MAKYRSDVVEFVIEVNEWYVIKILVNILFSDFISMIR